MVRRPLAERIHCRLLRSYPREFRARFGAGLQRDFREALAHAASRGRLARFRTVLFWCADALVSGARERLAASLRGRTSGRHLEVADLGAFAGGGRGGRPLGELGRDLRIAARRLRRQPVLVAVVVLTLGLAIGAATTVFSMVDALFLRPLAYPAAERLVALRTLGNDGRTGTKLSQPDARDLASMVGDLESVALFDWGAVGLAGGTGGPEMVRSAHVSASFLPTLGVAPALGRAFLPEEDSPGGGDVAILSDGLWRRRFGADSAVVGHTVWIQSRPHTVVGVLPSDFEDPAAGDGGYAEVLVPLALDGSLSEREARWLQAIARLSPERTVGRVTQELHAASARLARSHPETNEGVGFFVVPLREAIWGEARRPVTLMLVATLAVLLIACSNLANILLARGASRSREMAVQRAIGAGGLRIGWQLMLESLLLALAGGGAGLGITYGASSLARVALGNELPRLAGAGPDPGVLLFALGASLMAGLAFGLLPSLQAVRASPLAALEGGRGVVPGSERGRVRRVLVAVQVSLSVVLLAGAALLLRSVRELTQVEPGFDRASRLSWELVLPSERYSNPAQVLDFDDRLEKGIKGIPGVVAVGGINKPPLGTRWGCDAFAVEGAPRPERSEDWPCAEARAITPTYLSAAGTRLKRGRSLEEGDGAGAPRVVLVNEALAAQLWRGEDPIGEQVAWAQELGEPIPWRTVVGVVADVKHRGLDVPPEPAVYMPLSQAPDRRITWVAHTSRPPLELIAAVREAVGKLDPTLALRQPRTLSSAVAASIGPHRYAAAALGCIAAFALALALLGVHGVLSFMVAQRRSEIGVRLAFGASDRDVMRSVLGDGLATVAPAAAIGLVAAFVLARVLRSFLYGVAPSDPASYGLVALVVLLAALAGCWIPAYRAAHLDPTVALRSG